MGTATLGSHAQTGSNPSQHGSRPLPQHLANGFSQQGHASHPSANPPAALLHPSMSAPGTFMRAQPGHPASSTPQQPPRHPSSPPQPALNCHSQLLAGPRQPLCNGATPGSFPLPQGVQVPGMLPSPVQQQSQQHPQSSTGAPHSSATMQSQAQAQLQGKPWPQVQGSMGQGMMGQHQQQQQQQGQGQGQRLQSSIVQQGNASHAQTQGAPQNACLQAARPGMQQQQQPGIKQESSESRQQASSLPQQSLPQPSYSQQVTRWRLPQPQGGMQQVPLPWQHPQSMAAAFSSQQQQHHPPQHPSQQPSSLPVAQNRMQHPSLQQPPSIPSALHALLPPAMPACQQGKQAQPGLAQQSSQPMPDSLPPALQTGVKQEQQQEGPASPPGMSEHTCRQLRRLTAAHHAPDSATVHALAVQCSQSDSGSERVPGS